MHILLVIMVIFSTFTAFWRGYKTNTLENIALALCAISSAVYLFSDSMNAFLTAILMFYVFIITWVVKQYFEVLEQIEN